MFLEYANIIRKYINMQLVTVIFLLLVQFDKRCLFVYVNTNDEQDKIALGSVLKSLP